MTLIMLCALILFILQTLFDYWLDFLNIRHMKIMSGIIPAEFEGQVDRTLLLKTQQYTIERTRLGILSSLLTSVIIVVFLFGGGLPWYDRFISSLELPFVVSGLIFFLLLSFASSIISIPFSLYRTFVTEKKYGFNTMTLKTWVADFMKSLVLSTVIMGMLISAGLWIVQKSPGFWWLYVWGLFFVFSVFMMYIAPYVIEPLFNKFEPVRDEGLLQGIKRIAEKAGIKVSRVFSMDASKRTKHTNAYFTGIGKVKRIVLYDTLIEKMSAGEVFSVLAHEIGHWKKKHIFKMLFVVETISLIVLYVAFHILKIGIIGPLFQIEHAQFYTEAVLIVFLLSLIMFPAGPLFHALSRKHEREADRFSLELTGDPGSMISTLVKLSKDNLSNLYPHPLYAAFHYSHPPVLDRIRAIKDSAHLK